MALSLIESIRKLIRQDTVKIGGPVGNLHGAVSSDIGELGTATTQTWLRMTIPGRTMPTLTDFLDAFADNPSAMTLDVATAGVLTASLAANTVTLFRSVVTTTRSVTFNLDVALPAGTAEAAVFVDGTLLRSVRGQVAVPVTLSAGRHKLYVLVSSPSVTLTVPTTVSLTGETDIPRIPQWVSLTSTYQDPQSGVPANVLKWVADPEAGGYRVLRREPQLIGDLETEGDGAVTEVTALGAGDTYNITIAGDHGLRLQTNTTLLAQSEAVGVVVRVTVDSTPNTIITCRLPLGVSAPPSDLVGQQVYTGTLSEVGRVTRTASTATVEYWDSPVTTGTAYEYAIQATGLVDETILSPLSTIRYIVTGDVYPPGPIVLETDYPFVLNKNITARFTTPSDPDYAGVHVYYRDEIKTPDTNVWYTAATVGTTTVNDVVRSTVTITSGALPTDGTGLLDYFCQFDVPDYADYGFKVLSNTATQLVLTEQMPTELAAAIAAATSDPNIVLFQDTQIKTDAGLPNRVDECSFDALDYGVYYFSSFDRSGNEQSPRDSVYWTYTTADDHYTSGPVVALRQLTDAEQALFTAPVDYTDTTRYAIVELFAYTPEKATSKKFEGIALYYQRKTDDAPFVLSPVPQQTHNTFPWILTDAADAAVDDTVGKALTSYGRNGNVATFVMPQPHGLVVNQLFEVYGAADPSFNGTFKVKTVASSTIVTVTNAGPNVATTATSGKFRLRSRFVLLDRSEDNMFIRFWAVDEQGRESDQFMFLVDMNRTPQITSLETTVDPTTNSVSFVAIGDDDTHGLRWWVDPADTGEPTAAAPRHIGDPSIKTFTSDLPIALSLGQSKTLFVQPYAVWNATTSQAEGLAGDPVERLLVRTPRSFVSTDQRDENGQFDAGKVTVTFTMLPTPVPVRSGTGGTVANSGTTFTLSNAGWVANAYNSGSATRFYYLLLLDSSNNRVAIAGINSNTATMLTLADQVPLTGWTKWQIVDGAVQYRLRTVSSTGEVDPGTSLTGYRPTVGKLTRPASSTFYVDFYATKNGCLPESPRTVLVDTNNEATFGSFTLTYDSASTKLTATAANPDDDCKYWELYLKKGSWPTTPEAQNNATLALDTRYMRYISPDVAPSALVYTQNADPDGSTWYAIAVPYNSFNQPGTRLTATRTVGQGQSDYRLTGFSFAPQAGTANAVCTYTATSGTTGTVTVTAFDNANPANVKTASGAVAAGVTSTPIDLGLTVSATATTNQRTWTATATLSGGNGTGTQTTTKSFYATVGSGGGGGGSTEPALSSLYIFKDESGFCPASGGCLSQQFQPLQIGTTWGDANTDMITYFIAVEVSRDGNPWILLTSSILPTGAGYYSYQPPCLYESNSTIGTQATYQFRISVIRQDNGQTVTSATTPYLSVWVSECTASYGGGGGSGGGGTGGGEAQT